MPILRHTATATAIHTIVIFILALTLASCDEFVPRDYTRTVPTGGPIEARYLALGPDSVTHNDIAVQDSAMERIAVWYPSTLRRSHRRRPAVVMVNGTGVKASRYTALFHHLASWGFIVVGCEDPSMGDGRTADRLLAYVLRADRDKHSVLYRRVDTLALGISGHSQGGAGAINAVTVRPHHRRYKAAVALSPTNQATARAFKWGCDIDKVETPLLMVAGTQGDFETKAVLSLPQMREMFALVRGPKVMMRRTGAEHGQTLYAADGYVTAWLRWQLQGDQRAARAFTGRTPEILNNTHYQDINLSLDQ